MTRVLICGLDGYIGWPLSLRLIAQEGFETAGIDNLSRRNLVQEVGSKSAIPILSIKERLASAKEVLGGAPTFYEGDLRSYDFVSHVLEEFRPDAIIHLGEMPSAPYSMIDASHAYFTQENNTLGTLNLLFGMRDHVPEAHLVKLGTMGEYGTPNVDIPEGFFEVRHNGRRDWLPFPRQPGSFYHLSKVHDSSNILFACRTWGLQSTDIMQGVVYGTRTDEIDNDPRLATRFDFDEVFGTAINRFCTQAVIGHPLTVYGKGGQQRGFIALRDSLQCLTLALRNPPSETGEYRVFNQFDDTYDVITLANVVSDVAREMGLDTTVRQYKNPRTEAEEHYYNPVSRKLRDLGFKPQNTLREELRVMLRDLSLHRDRIKEQRMVIEPRTRWNPNGQE